MDWNVLKMSYNQSESFWLASSGNDSTQQLVDTNSTVILNDQSDVWVSDSQRSLPFFGFFPLNRLLTTDKSDKFPTGHLWSGVEKANLSRAHTSCCEACSALYHDTLRVAIAVQICVLAPVWERMNESVHFHTQTLALDTGLWGWDEPASDPFMANHKLTPGLGLQRYIHDIQRCPERSNSDVLCVGYVLY